MSEFIKLIISNFKSIIAVIVSSFAFYKFKQRDITINEQKEKLKQKQREIEAKAREIQIQKQNVQQVKKEVEQTVLKDETEKKIIKTENSINQQKDSLKKAVWKKVDDSPDNVEYKVSL